jgi:hypothetical protein
VSRCFPIATRPRFIHPPSPRNAVIYEGDAARLWVAHDDRSIELRKIKTFLYDRKLMQVLDGVRVGEKVVTKLGNCPGSSSSLASTSQRRISDGSAKTTTEDKR